MPKRSIIFSIILFLSIHSLAFAGGVTIITHGFNSESRGWVAHMGLNIGYRIIDLTEEIEGEALSSDPYAIYELEITNIQSNIVDFDYNGSVSPEELVHPRPLYWGLNNLNGVSMNSSRNGEAIINVGWSDIDTLGSDRALTQDVAFVVRDALSRTDPAFGDSSPFSVPLHLIGHSRGGSLMGALSMYLSEWNIWVDHLTFLDPHPIANDYGYSSGIELTDNIRFTDNYFREGLGQVNGISVDGTYESELNNSFLENDIPGGYQDNWGIFGSDEHADVHLWYHGTIDINEGITDGEASVNSDFIGSWYSEIQSMPGPRKEVGYNYSRIVGKDRPADGIANLSSRIVIEKDLTHIANLDASLTIDTSSTKTIGEDIPVDYLYQAIEDCSISFGFDEDPNPFNSNESYLHTIPRLPATSNGTVFDGGLLQSIPIETSSMAAGSYYIVARIVGGSGFTRYVHSRELVTLVEEVEPQPEPDFREPNNSPEQATDLGVIAGEEHFERDVDIQSGDADYYRFEIVEIGTSENAVELYLPPPSTGRDENDIDLALGKLNNNGQLVPAANSDYWIQSISDSSTRNERVSLEGYDPGVYFAIVYGASSFTDTAETTPDYDFTQGQEDSDYRLLITGPMPTVITPVLTPDSGTFIGSTFVTITSSTPNADIRYTTDGTNPTANSARYIRPIKIDSSCTVSAIAIKDRYNDSPVASANYTINQPAELAVAPISHTVDHSTGSVSISVENIGGGTMPWTASVISGVDWLSITSGSSGTDSGTITLNYSVNTSDSSRPGTIRITATGADASPQDVTVLQTGTPEYIITSNINGNGSITLNPAGGTYDEGTQVTITAVPGPDYQFDHWEGDASGDINPLTVTVNGDMSIAAVFSLIFVPPDHYRVTTSTQGSGTIDLDPVGGVYTAGSQVTLTATPNANYLFDHWQGDASGTANPLMLTINNNMSVTAVFVEQQGYSATYPTEDGPITVTVSAGDLAVQAANETVQDNLEFIYMPMDITIANIVVGSTVEISIELPTAALAEALVYKHINGRWVDFDSNCQFNPDRTRITFQITDGGYGDIDNAANGQIADPIGLATTVDDTPSGGGGGGGGGCFITVSQN